MSQEPDPQQPSAWPGPPWDQQQPPTDPPPGPQPRRAQGQDPPPGPQSRLAQGEPPKRTTFGWLALSLATVGALIVGGIAGSLVASGDGGTAAIPAATVTVTATEAAEPEPAPTVTTPETTKAEAEPEPEPDSISDGSYEVGVDIDPGRYKTVTPAEDNGSVCYAEVSIGDDPLETEITYSGPTIIDIPNKNRAIFESFDCGEWKRTR